METWKPIPGFSRYEASNTGKLRSLNYKNSGKIKELKPARSKDGYLQTMLQDDIGKYHSYKVHKFVTFAFYGVRPEGLEVNHQDGIKINTNIDNLEYCTRSQNMIHAFKNGLEEPLRGSANGMAKLTEQNVIEIRKHVKESKSRFYGRDALAKKYGVSSSHIKDIISGRRGIWSCVPMI